ncbi:MAG: hypothetical protein ACREOY_01020 [Candidatus Dormibacteraceae bacterium]
MFSRDEEGPWLWTPKPGRVTDAWGALVLSFALVPFQDWAAAKG